MTTTADKISEIESRIEIIRNTYLESLAALREDLEELKAEVNPPKPPDPKPLACWLNVGPEGEFYEAHKSEEDAQNSRGVTYLHMRQVTPQDERDLEDARRYREYFRRNADLGCYAGGSILVVKNGLALDEMIDKAMEEK